MKQFLLPLFLTTLLCTTGVRAFVVSDIRIEGLQRVSSGTVYGVLPVETGQNVSNDEISEAIRALFKTGYFEDISVARDGDVLVVTVVERPSISEIVIEGNKTIKTEDLMAGLKKSGLAEGEIFQQATLAAIRLELERQYVAQGRYSASITTELDTLESNRIKVTINVREGKVATIRHINVVGNNTFPRDELIGLFELKPTGRFSFLGSKDKYSREKLAGDLERLRSWYLDRGYINFAIRSTQVSISPDRQHVFITVNIDEGERYRISNVRFSGDLIIPHEEAEALLTIEPGDVFSRKDVITTERALSKRLGKEGYILSKVTSIPEPNALTRGVDVTFFVEPGKRTYVRRINFSGNTKTEDEVLRREVRQQEGSLASNEKIDQSKLRLERLGFFKGVEVETVPVPGTGDQVDVSYTVEEQPSGSVSASIGYSQSDGLLLGASVSQTNFLGTGNKVSLGINKSDISELYSYSFTNPYYTIDGVSRGFSLYHRAYDYEDTDISNYAADTTGASVNYGYPISETESINFGLGGDLTSINTGSGTPQYIKDYLNTYGEEYVNYKTSVGWSLNRLNRGMLPTAGYSQSISAQLTTPNSDTSIYKLVYRGQYFQPLTDSLTGRFSIRLGYLGGYGDTTDVPFFEHFYAGGYGSVRGYRDNSLGPKAQDTLTGEYNAVGGDTLIDGTIEVLFPLPFVKDQRSLRTSLFFDYGNVFDTSCPSSSGVVNCSTVDPANFRYSVGIGLTWVTPLGPLTFSLAEALKVEPYDERQSFQFSLGTPF